MPKLEQSTVNVDMITSIYDTSSNVMTERGTGSGTSSPKEPRSPRAQG